MSTSEELPPTLVRKMSALDNPLPSTSFMDGPFTSEVFNGVDIQEMQIHEYDLLL